MLLGFIRPQRSLLQGTVVITTHGSYTHASPPTIKEGDEDECIRLDHPPAKKVKSTKSGVSNVCRGGAIGKWRDMSVWMLASREKSQYKTYIV